MSMEKYITKGLWYACTKEYERLGAKFTAGKLYKCNEHRVLCDDHNAPKTCLESLGIFRKATKEEVKEYWANERRKRKELLLRSKGLYLV